MKGFNLLNELDTVLGFKPNKVAAKGPRVAGGSYGPHISQANNFGQGSKETEHAFRPRMAIPTP